MENSSHFISTKFSKINNDAKKEFQATTYRSYKSEKNKTAKPIDKNVITKNNMLYDVKNARHEILKFGMSGFDGAKKHQAKIQLAIKLGAKQPKRLYKNYKQLLAEKKHKTMIDNQNFKFQQLGKNEFGESLVKYKKFNCKRKILKGSLLDAYGTVKGNQKIKQK